MKRFQDCNKIERVWRYRWYLLIPFKWFWMNYCIGMTVGLDDEDENGNLVHTEDFYIPTGKELWSILIGEAQCNMKWYWTHEEVLQKLKGKYERD
jgi:hypothetical protein